MEVLLLAAACWLAFEGGSQTEQAKLGVSPAQRAQMREHTRHEKTLQKIADKHGGTPVPAHAPEAVKASNSARTDTSTAPAGAAAAPGTFSAGYRQHVPCAPPLAERAGNWAGHGVMWVKDGGRKAVQGYRKRRTAEGQPDPAPKLIPLPPNYPPTVGEDRPKVSLTKPDVPPSGQDPPEPAAQTPEEASEARTPPAVDPVQPEEPNGPHRATQAPEEPVAVPAPREAEPDEAAPAATRKEDKDRVDALLKALEDLVRPEEKLRTAPLPGRPERDDDNADTPVDTAVTHTDTADTPDTETVTETDTADTETVTETDTADTPTVPPTEAPSTPTGGTVTQVADIHYQSVLEESDDLSALCEEDGIVYQRIIDMCDAEIGGGEELIAALRSSGGENATSEIADVVSCMEDYAVLRNVMEDLRRDTLGQHEAVQKGKALLIAGQGAYAAAALDQEVTYERDYYLNDTVNDADLESHDESYDLQGAHA